MNKRFLLVAALCAAMNLSSFADDTNLALNKPVVASTETADERASNAVDGDLGTRWQVDATQKDKESVADDEKDMTVTNGHWIYVDLQDETEFNTIRVKWEGAYAKGFKILVANEMDEATGEPKWQDEAVLTKNEVLTDFTKNYTYFLDQPVKARYVKLQATELGFTGNWFSLYEFSIYNLTVDEKVSAITSLTTSTPFVTLDDAFAVNAVDQFANVMTDELTYEATNATQQLDGTFKANGVGVVSIKAIDKQGNVKEVQLYAVSSAPATPALGANDMPIFIEKADGLEIYNSAWEGGYTTQNIMSLGTKNVTAVTQVATFGWQKTAIADDDTDYKTLEFDIFPTKDLNKVYVQYENAGLQNLTFSAQAGKWNHISLDIDGGAKYNGYIKFKVADEAVAKADRPDILLANVYLTKDAAGNQGISFGKADEKGFVTVKGTITADDLATLKETDGTAFDLTKVTLDEGVSTIAFKNPNAILIVPGEVNADGVGVPTADWGDTKNVVVKRADGYYFPAKQLEISDSHPVYRTFFISTGNVGYKYTRPLAAKSYSWAFLPSVATIPSGCLAYQFVADAADANKVQLNKVENLNAKVPYLIYNGNEDVVNLECAGIGDMNFIAEANPDPDLTTTVGNLNIIGTFDSFKGSDKTGDIYEIQGEADNDLTLKKVTEETVSPFHLYFTVADGADAKAISFVFDTPTGIKSIETADAAKAGNVYSLDGKLVRSHATSVEGLAKGVYVINGKKYVVK